MPTPDNLAIGIFSATRCSGHRQFLFGEQGLEFTLLRSSIHVWQRLGVQGREFLHERQPQFVGGSQLLVACFDGDAFRRDVKVQSVDFFADPMIDRRGCSAASRAGI